MGKLIDLTGQKFGRLTVIEMSSERTPSGRVKWNCKCSCGNVSVVSSLGLRQGSSKSCGCLRAYRPRMNIARRVYSDERSGDELYQDEILGKY